MNSFLPMGDRCDRLSRKGGYALLTFGAIIGFLGLDELGDH